VENVADRRERNYAKRKKRTMEWRKMKKGEVLRRQ